MNDKKRIELQMREQGIAGLARQFLIASWGATDGPADIENCFRWAEDFIDHSALRMQELNEELDREVDEEKAPR